MRTALALCILLVLSSASPARAEWHFTPMVGLTMLGSTTIFDPQLATEARHWNVGGAVGLIGRGLFGAEVVTVWTPGFFERDDPTGEPGSTPPPGVVSSRTISLMANAVVTAPQRWTEYSLRPFVSGGFGLIHVNKVDPEGLFPVRLNLAGFNVGGGAIGFLSERTGVRFDVRYHSTLRPTDHGPIATGDVRLRYLTASIGIVFRR